MSDYMNELMGLEWIGPKSHGNVKNKKDFTIKLHKGERPAFSFIFRNENMRNFNDGVKFAFSKDFRRMFIINDKDGYTISHPKKQKHGYTKISATMCPEGMKAWVGDYELKEMDIKGIYYIER